FRPGPVFTNVLLADEINRTPPKTQAALLEAMQEAQVSVDGVSHPLPQPFLVVATQNPIEYEGTYPLPEAQLDRFLLKVDVGYPTVADEEAILRLAHRGVAPATLEQVQAAAGPATPSPPPWPRSPSPAERSGPPRHESDAPARSAPGRRRPRLSLPAGGAAGPRHPRAAGRGGRRRHGRPAAAPAGAVGAPGPGPGGGGRTRRRRRRRRGRGPGPPARPARPRPRSPRGGRAAHRPARPPASGA